MALKKRKIAPRKFEHVLFDHLELPEEEQAKFVFRAPTAREHNNNSDTFDEACSLSVGDEGRTVVGLLVDVLEGNGKDQDGRERLPFITDSTLEGTLDDCLEYGQILELFLVLVNKGWVLPNEAKKNCSAQSPTSTADSVKDAGKVSARDSSSLGILDSTLNVLPAKTSGTTAKNAEEPVTGH